MGKFFKLVDNFWIETSHDLSSCSEEREDDLFDEIDEADLRFWGEDSSKSFQKLIEDKIVDWESRWQPYIRALSYLLDSGEEFDVNEKEPGQGSTILMKVVGTGRLDLVRTLVEAGADVNAQREDGGFALQEAAYSEEIFDYLAPLTAPNLRPYAEELIPEARLDRQRKTNYAIEAFVYAAICGNAGAVSEAIASGIDVNAIGSTGETALHKACCNRQPLIVRTLLDNGANPSLKDEGSGSPPLMSVLWSRPYNMENFRMLIEAGADVNAKNNDGITLLIAAIDRECVEAVRLLLEAGANVNARSINDWTALTFLKEDSSIPNEISNEILEILLTAGAEDEYNSNA